MWKQLADYIKQVFLVQQETQKNKADIVELRQELKEIQNELRNLTAAMQQIAHEFIRNQQNEAHEREKWHFDSRLSCCARDVNCRQVYPIKNKARIETGLNSVSCSPYRVSIARLAAAQANLKDGGSNRDR